MCSKPANLPLKIFDKKNKNDVGALKMFYNNASGPGNAERISVDCKNLFIETLFLDLKLLIII
jgi:hypothetical protein